MFQAKIISGYFIELKFCEKPNIYSLKMCPHKVCFNYKGKNNNILEKTGRYHLNHMIWIDITSNGQISCASQEGYIVTFVVLLSKMHELNLKIRKYQTDTNWETFYKVSDIYSSEMSRSWKTKTDELLQIKGDITTIFKQILN